MVLSVFHLQLVKQPHRLYCDVVKPTHTHAHTQTHARTHARTHTCHSDRVTFSLRSGVVDYGCYGDQWERGPLWSWSSDSRVTLLCCSQSKRLLSGLLWLLHPATPPRRRPQVHRMGRARAEWLRSSQLTLEMTKERSKNADRIHFRIIYIYPHTWVPAHMYTHTHTHYKQTLVHIHRHTQISTYC